MGCRPNSIRALSLPTTSPAANLISALCSIVLCACVLFDTGPTVPTPNSPGDDLTAGDTPADSTDAPTDAIDSAVDIVEVSAITDVDGDIEKDPNTNPDLTDVPTDAPTDLPTDVADTTGDSVDVLDTADAEEDHLGEVPDTDDEEPLTDPPTEVLIDTNDAFGDCGEDAPASVIIWVDADNDTGTENGTEDYPYTTITDALGVAGECYIIQIRPGTYVESLDITTSYLILRGMGATPAETTIENSGEDQTVRMAGESIIIENLSTTGGPNGVVLSNCDSCQLRGLEISDVVGDNGDIETDAPDTGDVGGDAVGVTIENSEGFLLENNTISSVTAGSGGGGAWSGTGGSGGLAIGVYLFTASGTLDTNTLEHINGGAGGRGGNSGSGGVGGLGVGIYLADSSTGNILTDNQISAIAGGAGGDGGDFGTAGADQTSFGIYFDDTSLANQIDRSNTVAGNEVVFVHGQEDLVVDGTTLTVSTNPMNYGVIVIIDSTNITVRDWDISGFTGASGITGASGLTGAGESGGDGFGIFVSGSTCTLENNEIEGINGGQGGTGGYQRYEATGPGGVGVGILLNESDCTLRGNTISGINGGPGGDGGYEGVGGPGGIGVGIRAVGSAGDIEGNIVSTIEDGELGPLGEICTAPDPYCVYVLDGWAAGIWIESGVSPYEIVNNTFWSIQGGETTAAIYVDTGSHSAHVMNTVFSVVNGGPCLFNSGDNDATQLQYEYDMFNGCEQGRDSNATAVTGNLDADPAFESAVFGDFRLECDETSCSPAVDMGHPSSSCVLEPAENGCRVNIGAFGNTSKAAADPSASDCREICPPL